MKCPFYVLFSDLLQLPLCLKCKILKFRGSNQIISTFWSIRTSKLIGSREFQETVQNQENISLRTGNRKPGMKKGNIQGIPVFLEKWRTSRQFWGTLFPWNMQLSTYIRVHIFSIRVIFAGCPSIAALRRDDSDLFWRKLCFPLY